MTRTEITEGDYDTVDQSKARGEPLKQPPHARASRLEDHAAPNPRSRGRAAEKKDMPEPHSGKRKMSPIRGTPLPSAMKNSPSVTPSKPVTPKERQLNTLAATPPTAHIRTVPKPKPTQRMVKSWSREIKSVTPRLSAERK